MIKGMLVSVLVLSIASVLVVYGCAGKAPTSVTVAATLEPASTATPVTAKYKWRMPTFSFPGTTEYTATAEFIKVLKTASGGQIDITLYPAGQLVPVLEMTPALGKGLFEISLGNPLYNLGALPVGEFFSGVPFGPERIEDLYHLFYTEGLVDTAREAYAKVFNVYYLGPEFATPYGAIMSKKPIRSETDLKGLKLISFGMTGEVYKEFGASVVSIPWVEVYTAASTGIVDAANLGGPRTFLDSRIQEIFKYYTGPSITPYLSGYLGVNLDLWKSLPDNIKGLLQGVMGGYQLNLIQTLAYEDIMAQQQMTKAGVTFSSFTDDVVAKMRNMAIGFWDKGAQADRSSAQVVTLMKDYMSRIAP